MKEWELVKMDDRFVSWLNNRDVADAVDELKGDETYLLISRTEDHETTVDTCCGGIDDAKKMVANIVDHAPEQGYMPCALFDLKAKKEVEFKMITHVIFKED